MVSRKRLWAAVWKIIKQVVEFFWGFFKKRDEPHRQFLKSHLYFHFHGNEALQCFHSASIIRGKLVHALLAVVPPRWAMGNTSIHIAELEATLMKGPLHECAIRIICCNYYLNERILNFFTTRMDASKLATWQNWMLATLSTSSMFQSIKLYRSTSNFRLWNSRCIILSLWMVLYIVFFLGSNLPSGLNQTASGWPAWSLTDLPCDYFAL